VLVMGVIAMSDLGGSAPAGWADAGGTLLLSQCIFDVPAGAFAFSGCTTTVCRASMC
jgi:hypothetical protein